MAAFQKNDIKGVMAVCADDYQGVGQDGKPLNRKQMEAQMKSYMATTKKSQLTVKIPQRRFIGNSRMLNTLLRAVIIEQMSKALK